MIDYTKRLAQAKQALREADALVIGGGAGLSEAAGLQFSGASFQQHFAPFIARYGFTDLYTSSFYPFETPEERWAYWAKHISFARYESGTKALYQNLSSLVATKPHFVITTNVDHQFLKAGFHRDNVFPVQGDYGLFQCSQRCHDTLYDNQAMIEAMIAQTVDCRIPTALIPRCPRCGEEMDVHVHKDESFVMGDTWHEDEKRYATFLKEHAMQKVVFLELGVGFNTPGIIRLPFEQLTFANPNATLLRMNRDHADASRNNASRTISFEEDMEELVQQLLSDSQTEEKKGM